MPLLTRLARTTDDYRALKAGVAIVSAAGALTPLAANTQEPKAVQTAQAAVPAVKASYIKPPMPLEPHCADIKLVFDAVEFKGEYRGRAYAWLAGGCKGDVPVPEAGDNMKRFNASATILQNGANIVLTP